MATFSKRNKSLAKSGAARVLADTFLVFKAAAKEASALDAAIVRIVARGVHFRRRWRTG